MIPRLWHSVLFWVFDILTHLFPLGAVKFQEPCADRSGPDDALFGINLYASRFLKLCLVHRLRLSLAILTPVATNTDINIALPQLSRTSFILYHRECQDKTGW